MSVERVVGSAPKMVRDDIAKQKTVYVVVDIVGSVPRRKCMYEKNVSLRIRSCHTRRTSIR